MTLTPAAPRSPRAAARAWWRVRREHGPAVAVAKIVAVVLLACGSATLVAAAVDSLDGARAAAGLAAVGGATAALGLVLWRSSPFPSRLGAGEAFAAVVGAWAAMVATSTAAYLATGTFSSVDDAVFESVAGFTTTALSLLEPLESAPAGVLFWRATTQWLGGLGALLVVVGMLPFLGVGGVEATGAGRSPSTLVLLTARVRSLLQRLVVFYLALTLVGVGLYLAGGMELFDAVTYAFTTISTGGFANHTRSFAHFDSATLEWLAVGGMVLAGANLALVWQGVRGLSGSVLRSTELRAYVAILVVAGVVLLAWTAPPGGPTHESARHALFTVASAVSTTGFTVTDWGGWVVGAQLLLLALVGVGSMSGSTGGGFRILRALALLGYARREVLRQLHPRAVVAVKLSGVPIDEALTRRMIGHQALYVVVVAAAAVAVAAFGTELTTAVSGAISAMATYGPALGDLDPSGGAAALTAPARAVLMAVMLIGRLEIYPVLLGGAALAALRRRAPVVAR